MNNHQLLRYLNPSNEHRYSYNQRKQAHRQIKVIIMKFDEECVKSYKVGYKAGIVNENTRMRKNQPEVAEELLEKLEEFRNCKITYSKILYTKEDEQLYQEMRKRIQNN